MQENFAKIPGFAKNFCHKYVVFENLLYPQIRKINLSRNFPVLQYLDITCCGQLWV